MANSNLRELQAFYNNVQSVETAISRQITQLERAMRVGITSDVNESNNAYIETINTAVGDLDTSSGLIGELVTARDSATAIMQSIDSLFESITPEN